MNLIGALLKKDDDAPPPPPKKHHYTVPMPTTLPAYDWAHTGKKRKRERSVLICLFSFCECTYTNSFFPFGNLWYSWIHHQTHRGQSSWSDSKRSASSSSSSSFVHIVVVGSVNTSVRLTNPLQLDALPPGKMAVLRKLPSSVGLVKVSDVSTSHLEGGEIMTVPLGETIGVSASRVQTGMVMKLLCFFANLL